MGFLTGSIYTEGLVPDAAVPAVQRDQGLQKTKSAHLFFSQRSLDYVCPEPVLVNRSFAAWKCLTTGRFPHLCSLQEGTHYPLEAIVVELAPGAEDGSTHGRRLVVAAPADLIPTQVEPLVWEDRRSLGNDACDNLPGLVLKRVQENMTEAAGCARRAVDENLRECTAEAAGVSRHIELRHNPAKNAARFLSASYNTCVCPEPVLVN